MKSAGTHVYTGEVEGRIDAGDEDAGDRLRLRVLLHVSVQVGPRQATQDRCVREPNLRTIVTISGGAGAEAV